MCLCAVVCYGSISLKENRKLKVGKDLQSKTRREVAEKYTSLARGHCMRRYCT